jgi:L-rhamnose isomerase
MNSSVEKRYSLARDQYAEYQVDTDQILRKLENVHLSIPCWQADDVTGFEVQEEITAGGGIMATGNYPGRARNLDEIRNDLTKVLSLVPGKHRINLHAMYGDFKGKKVDRDEINTSHFQSWIDWATSLGIALDFNSTFFAHPKANSGYTLSSKDPGIRSFWIEHGKLCREIASQMGAAQGTSCVHNTWIPDGCKDIIIDKWTHRQHLKNSLDEIFKKPYSKDLMKDSVESKLFGLGSESFVVGSYDFYLSYVMKNNLIICLDMGHFHPTESIGDKLSAILQFSDEILIHTTRSVRWDSDHVPILNHDLRELMLEIVRNDLLDRVILALDFFDASINRIAAYILGIRATQQALLAALLEPPTLKTETDKNHITLAIAEQAKILPIGAVWDYFCANQNVPPAADWLNEVQVYEAEFKKRV